MKKLKELPLTSLQLKYMEKISDTEVNHYCIDLCHKLATNQDSKTILEAFLKEEVEIETKKYSTDPLIVNCPDILSEKNKKLPTEKFTSMYEERIQKGFWNKAKFIINKYLKTRFRISYDTFKAIGIGLSFYKGEEVEAIAAFNLEIEDLNDYSDIVGFLCMPAIMRLADPILGEEKTAMFCYPVVKLNCYSDPKWCLDFSIEYEHKIKELRSRNIKVNNIIVSDGIETFDQWQTDSK